MLFLLFNVQLITYAIFICQLFDWFSRLNDFHLYVNDNEDFSEISYLILSLNGHFCLLDVVGHWFLCERSMRQVNSFSLVSNCLEHFHCHHSSLWHFRKTLMKFIHFSFQLNMESVYRWIVSFPKRKFHWNDSSIQWNDDENELNQLEKFLIELFWRRFILEWINFADRTKRRHSCFKHSKLRLKETFALLTFHPPKSFNVKNCFFPCQSLPWCSISFPSNFIGTNFILWTIDFIGLRQSTISPLQV